MESMSISLLNRRTPTLMFWDQGRNATMHSGWTFIKLSTSSQCFAVSSRFDQDVCDEAAHHSEFLCSIHGDTFYDNQTSFRQILAYSGGVSAKSDVPPEVRNWEQFLHLSHSHLDSEQTPGAAAASSLENIRRDWQCGGLGGLRNVFNLHEPPDTRQHHQAPCGHPGLCWPRPFSVSQLAAGRGSLLRPVHWGQDQERDLCLLSQGRQRRGAQPSRRPADRWAKVVRREEYDWLWLCQAVSSPSGEELPSSWTPTQSSTKWRKWSHARLVRSANGLTEFFSVSWENICRLPHPPRPSKTCKTCRLNVSLRLRSEIRGSGGSSKTRPLERWLLKCKRTISGSAYPASFTSITTKQRLRGWRVKRGDWRQNTSLRSWQRISRGKPRSLEVESGWNCLTWRLSWSPSTSCLTLRPRPTLRQFGKIIWTDKLFLYFTPQVP